ncbi:TPA: hypothetical protein ACUIRW_001326 [Klebsiella pneumoniae]|uniref:hypothetical protein n=1 Tax=Klebsiella TaxID=570 RepID=UPI001EFFE34A|nr:hypothetical protein [Klebsiella pneumoniae]MDH8531714.1 hypothetical protein [Klebsiella pneumoniae]MEE2389175.1 hypothetical protein [Klebsiella pneumoniae]HBY1787489.1 hypothetical protein [Klebsiella pneumoniae]
MNIKETPRWEDGIYQIKRGDRVSGGKDGTANIQPGQLANRTLFLYENLMEIRAAVYSEIMIASDIADGISRTQPGQYFRVYQGESSYNAFIYYYNDDGRAYAVAKEASGKMLSLYHTSVGLSGSQPNLFDNDVSDIRSLPYLKPSNVIPVMTEWNGTPCFAVSTVAGSAAEHQIWMGDFEASNFPSEYISSSLTVLHADGTEGTAPVRVILVQWDEGGNEILSHRAIVTVATKLEVTDPVIVPLPGIAKAPECTHVSLFLGVQSSVADTVRSVHFRDLMLCDGVNPVYRRRPASAPKTEEAIAGLDHLSFHTPKTLAETFDQWMQSFGAKNICNEPVFEKYTDGKVPEGWSGGAVVATIDGVKTLKTPGSVDALGIMSPLYDVSDLTDRHISVSVDIYQKKGDQGIDAGGNNNLRIRLAGYDESGRLIDSAWQNAKGNDDNNWSATANQYYTRNVTRSDITTRKRINVARSLALSADIKYIGLNIRVEGVNGIACPEMHLSNIVICAAPTAIFSPGKLPRRATYSGGDGLNWITEQMAADITKGKSFWNDLPNLFTDSQLKNTAAGQAVPGWDNSAKAVLKRGYMTLEQPPAGTVSAVGPSLLPGFEVSVSRFPSGRFSAAVDIIEKTGDQGVNSSGQNNLRVRIWAKDASGKLINTAWTGVSGNDDAAFATGPQYYTRYVPREDITSRTRLVIAENIPVPAEAVALVFNIRAEGVTGAPCPQMYLTNFVLRNGADCTWCAEAQSGQASSALSEVFISPGGSDANTGVSASSPMKTLAAAIAKINGVGSVYVAAGDYSLADFQADFSAVRNVAIIGVTTAAFKYPTIRGGVKLTGISKVSGYNQIYSAPLTGFASGTHPSWLWIDNLPDEDTRETAEYYHPVMRGRAQRMECTKIWLADTVRDAINRDTPVAWSKSDALTEIDGSTQPRCVWVESEGVVYFTFPDGGDPLTSGLDVYAAPTLQGIFRGSETQFSAKGRAIVTGLHLRYARLGTWGFRQSVISDITVLGAAENCFDIGNWTTAYNCKAAGSGSRNFVGTYDGFNMHNFSVFTHYTCWATDCLDDGWSSHENCTETGYSPVATLNLGSGLTPAYGAEATYYDPYTRGNALQVRKKNSKTAGIESHQSPIVSDPGVSTVVWVYNGISVGDYSGYVSGDTFNTPAKATLVAVNCKAIDPVYYGFRCTHIIDCGHSGTGTPRHDRTRVSATKLITE